MGAQFLLFNLRMSDQEFELEREIANVSQLKSFANFKNNYNKKVQKEAEPSQRQTINRSNQKLSDSYDKQNSRDKNHMERSEERQMRVIKEEPHTTDFVEEDGGRQYQEKQRITQETIPPKARQRTREYSQTPPYQHPSTSLSNSQRQFKPLKQTLQPSPYQSYYEPTSQPHPTYEQPSTSSFKAKFQELSAIFQQFKATSLKQKRRHKQQVFQNEQTIQRLKVRVYELEIREDELIMENKKINERLTKDFKSEKESQSLKSLLEARTEELRRATQEISYYRGQLDGNRKELQSSNLDSERYTLELREVKERLEYQQMEIENKERLQMELSQKISGLIKQNARLRDEVSELFRSNKQLEYENYSVKRELKRGGEGDSYNQYLNQRQAPSSSRINRQEESVIEPPKAQTKTRRRGEFNQERNRVNERKVQKQPKEMKETKQVKDGTFRRDPPSQTQPLLKRKQELQEEIGKMKEQRPMNGAMRRAKITLEQELEQIINKLSKINE